MNTTKILNESYQGVAIPFQSNDAYVNATVMCSAFGKRPNDFLSIGPTKAYIDAGYFTVVESKWTHPETGEAHVTLSTRVFQKGVDFIRRKLNEGEKPTI